MSRVKERFERWLRGTTCNRSERKSIYWVSEDGRFAVFKHHGHSEYVDRGSGVCWCETWYGLYDMEKAAPDCLGEPCLWKGKGRWRKEYENAVALAIAHATAGEEEEFEVELESLKMPDTGREIPWIKIRRRKGMSETPRTDEHDRQCNGMSDTEHLIALHKFTKELEAELADTRHDRDTWRIRAEAAEKVNDELHEELAEVRKDTERLDYLEKHGCAVHWIEAGIDDESNEDGYYIEISYQDKDNIGFCTHSEAPTLRKAIDAMKGQDEDEEYVPLLTDEDRAEGMER